MSAPTRRQVLIWVDQWQYQCCGTPLATGDTADLTVHPTRHARPWETAAGGPITLAAGHHAEPDHSHHLRVRLDRLLEARAHQQPSPDDDAWHPAPDSCEVHDVTEMKLWDEDWQPARHGGQPAGWILGATVLDAPPQRCPTPPATSVGKGIEADEQQPSAARASNRR